MQTLSNIQAECAEKLINLQVYERNLRSYKLLSKCNFGFLDFQHNKLNAISFHSLFMHTPC